MSFKEKNWQLYKLKDIIQFNPKESIKKKEIAKKIAMDKLEPFTRKVSGYEETEFTSGTKFRNGDTLLARITPCLENGKTAQVDILDENEIGFGSTEYIVLREKLGITFNDYIYYLSISPEFRNMAIKSMTGSSGRQRVQKDVLEESEIILPILEEQKAIAKILSDLDEKIEVNNKINKNLEEMAQAIFKQWFVDFEFPNEEGKPYKSSGGEMVESELGMIPSDFSIINLNQLGKIITGKTPSTKNLENFGDEYMFITPKDVKGDMYVTNTERLLSEKGTEKLKNNKIQPNSIGVTCIGSNLGEVYINSKYIFTNQQINSLVLNEDRTYPYVYILLKNMKEEFLNIASGSAVPIINKSTFSNLKVILPNKNILNRFNEIMISNFEIIRNNLDENERLEKLRDTLLPKLMSGEIRVPLENSEN
ncbi:restriction endonuclease subunit S [Clostridium perfringens]|uniref:restriction endonuclease subunit S n=1 Tax=Clostridium perfringens TaxID=1502 RepID=UPI0039E88E44